MAPQQCNPSLILGGGGIGAFVLFLNLFFRPHSNLTLPFLFCLFDFLWAGLQETPPPQNKTKQHNQKT